MAKPTKLVPREGKDGIRFYVSDDARIAYQILPNGQKKSVRATPTTCENSKLQSDANRKQRYLQFKGAFGNGKHILASHAVHLAWIGPIPQGYVVDHLNGITTDNRMSNLQAVTPEENSKRAGMLRCLRKAGRDPRQMSRDELLRLFDSFDLVEPDRQYEEELSNPIQFHLLND